MPNWVANTVVVRGPENEIGRFISKCFHVERCHDDEDNNADELELDFEAVIPIDATVLDAAAGAGDRDTLYRRHWGTKRDALDTAIIVRRPRYLHFEFITASAFPEPVYRELGRQFPQLEFNIAAIDPGAWWAVTGRIVGDDAVFDENADCRKVFERVYKQPFENALQADT
ncbi:hypothetical protein EET67_00735 [Pseudaminobacter arsenicus]|uniref:YubB ferredoxin-like domain-containing protein n=1 Tax=Borborobacter arsenicus TaxID=1851146 RepID=A0A432VBB7_9HYPH|nr:hypothetical protein [Pseudaminobacter arsenicus]RUM99469.1 hypothetical protein EET67_00735 [Pseudaminobacter arsenicus]